MGSYNYGKKNKQARKGQGRRPDYTVSAFDSSIGKGHPVGAAWINDDGRISIKLDRFVVLEGSGTLVISLFPMKWDDEGAEEKRKQKLAQYDPPEDFLPLADSDDSGGSDDPHEDDRDEIPF